MNSILKPVLKKLLKELLKEEDPFELNKGIPFLDPAAGLNGAEAAADEVVKKLRKAGVDDKQINYAKIVSDIEKGVLKEGIPLDKVKDSVFKVEKSRVDAKTTNPAPSLEAPNPDKKDEPSPETPTQPSEDKNDSGSGDADAEDDLENASPENKKFINDLMQPGDAVDDIILKKPQDLTEGEFTELKKRIIALPAGAEQDRLDKAATAFLEHQFGDGPAEHDAVGRMIDPQPNRAPPEAPSPLHTVEGKPLEAGLKRIGQAILIDTKNDGLAGAIKNLQGGINFLGDAKQKTPLPFPALKQDGVFGAKTRNGLRHAVTNLGQTKVLEGMALSRFNDFAREGQRKGFDGLAGATEKSIAPLFRDPSQAAVRPAEKIEAVTLQETLNDFGREQSDDIFRPLKLDGDIGPKTTGAFGQLTNALGPEPITKRFGEFLGFF